MEKNEFLIFITVLYFNFFVTYFSLKGYMGYTYSF